MWLIIEVDTELEYPNAYGPYSTEQDATAALPDWDRSGSTYWHVTELKALEIPLPANQQEDVLPARRSAIEELTDLYGSVENIPAVNPNVRAYAAQKLKDLLADLENGTHPDPEEQSNRLAQIVFFEKLMLVHTPSL